MKALFVLYIRKEEEDGCENKNEVQKNNLHVVVFVLICRGVSANSKSK